MVEDLHRGNQSEPIYSIRVDNNKENAVCLPSKLKYNNDIRNEV